MRKRMITNLRLTFAAAIAVPLALIGTTPASASGNGPYYDSDAYATGCAGTSSAHWYVANSVPLTTNSGTRGGWIQIWFSSSCGTNWGRVLAQPPAGTLVPQSEGAITTRTCQPNGCADGPSVDTTQVYVLADGTVISGQVWAPDVTACTYGYYAADVNGNLVQYTGTACA